MYIIQRGENNLGRLIESSLKLERFSVLDRNQCIYSKHFCLRAQTKLAEDEPAFSREKSDVTTHITKFSQKLDFSRVLGLTLIVATDLCLQSLRSWYGELSPLAKLIQFIESGPSDNIGLSIIYLIALKEIAVL